MDMILFLTFFVKLEIPDLCLFFRLTHCKPMGHDGILSARYQQDISKNVLKRSLKLGMLIGDNEKIT